MTQIPEGLQPPQAQQPTESLRPVPSQPIFRTEVANVHLNQQQNEKYVTKKVDETPEDFNPANDAMPINSVLDGKQTNSDVISKLPPYNMPKDTPVEKPPPPKAADPKITTYGLPEAPSLAEKPYQATTPPARLDLKTIPKNQQEQPFITSAQKTVLDEQKSTTRTKNEKGRPPKGLRRAVAIPAIGGAVTMAVAGGALHHEAAPAVPPPTSTGIHESLPEFPTSFNGPETIKFEVDESLKCPDTQTVEIKQGDSLTQTLIDVNGMARYLGTNGQLETEQLYQDLACMLALDQNRQVLWESDPTVAQFVTELTSTSNQILIGRATADKLLDGLKVINDRRAIPGADSQLAIIQPGQTVTTPNFSSKP
ncbi:MAG TPA: hypothetical protein VLE91_00095 [Candidatus Saccharimonadales bacterium]|nr:hypothetical protein [Candidatus Saccharimonadales bacterium]